VRGDCSFVGIGGFVEHHCLKFLFIAIEEHEPNKKPDVDAGAP